MKRIIEYILFVINTIVLALICYINALNIIDNYKINENEINPFLWFLIALIIIVINTYLFIKQIKRILTSLILILILIISGFIFVHFIDYRNECLHEFIYKGKVTFEKQDTSNTYAIAFQDLEGLLHYGYNSSFPDSLNKYNRIITLRNYYNNDIANTDSSISVVDTILTETTYTGSIDKSISINYYDTIRNNQFNIEGSFYSLCDLGIKSVKHVSKIPIRIYKNGNLLLDTCLIVKPNMVKYRNDKIVIEFDELKIKNAP